MTKKIYYIFTLIGSLLLSSCDSYLDIQPVGQVIPNTLAEYRALFTTAYNTALNDRGICEIRTDIATILQSDATSKNSLGDVEKWNDVNPNASTLSLIHISRSCCRTVSELPILLHAIIMRTRCV